MLTTELAHVESELSSSVYQVRPTVDLTHWNLTKRVQQDEATWSRMLTVTGCLLSHPSVTMQYPGVADLHRTTIIPAIKLGKGQIRDAALKSLGKNSIARISPNCNVTQNNS